MWLYICSGSTLNDFGNDFTSGKAWIDGLCQLDSDEDGFINGQELGDPVSVLCDIPGVSHARDSECTQARCVITHRCVFGCV